MKRVWLGALCAVALAAGAFAWQPPQEARGQRPAVAPPLPVAAAITGGDLIVVPHSAERGQTLTVIDPRQRVMGVYFVDAATGKIALRSVRDIRWDLQMTSFNNEPPLPQEIRANLEAH